ncbi:hypothetical protein M413DRAFT_13250 [Hebeloma cylindrosporum]|uniref:Uncharacterized protein n=1 Tax=Hebeloma cylindrosporum TaxID=76867 RepID=A0A0C2Y930_HEBCY|nr:hypothetical protein M413DRAFT_13250 [Hebeloma cylindrosporum h7]
MTGPWVPVRKDGLVTWRNAIVCGIRIKKWNEDTVVMRNSKRNSKKEIDIRTSTSRKRRKHAMHVPPPRSSPAFCHLWLSVPYEDRKALLVLEWMLPTVQASYVLSVAEITVWKRERPSWNMRGGDRKRSGQGEETWLEFDFRYNFKYKLTDYSSNDEKKESRIQKLLFWNYVQTTSERSLEKIAANRGKQVLIYLYQRQAQS